jgi:hypothetical protein
MPKHRGHLKIALLTETGARHVIRFLNTLLDLYRNHGLAASVYGSMVCGAPRPGDPCS